MKKCATRFAGFLCALCLVAAANSPGPAVGYDALADIDRVWAYTGGVHTAMISSTDTTGGNMDMSNFHGRYRGEKVMARIDGPGCVYRIWSALPSGRIKIYLDGGTRPEIDCAMKDYLKGTCKGLPGNFAVGRAANYMPIPFAKSIIITAPGFNFPGYYQVSYQTYDPGVTVETFRQETAGQAPGLEAAIKTWKDGAFAGKDSSVKRAEDKVALPTGGGLRIDGSGVLRELKISRAGNPADPIKGAVIRIYYDGSTEPAVDAPLDAFFINRFNLKSHWPGGAMKNLFLEADAQGYRSVIPMPYAQSLRIEITGGEDMEINIAVAFEELDSLPADAMYFHARYAEKDYDTDLSPDKTFTTKTAVNPDTNYVVLDRKGAGHYLGAAIFVESVGTLWWGEGDEMTWIDGAAQPQIRGTGTEDEFNWSWGYMPHLSPVSGTLPSVPECDENIAAQIIPQLRNPECNKIAGQNIAFRFRPTDFVAFSSSIKVSYEIIGSSMTATRAITSGNWSQHRGDDYASVAYWYERN